MQLLQDFKCDVFLEFARHGFGLMEAAEEEHVIVFSFFEEAFVCLIILLLFGQFCHFIPYFYLSRNSLLPLTLSWLMLTGISITRSSSVPLNSLIDCLLDYPFHVLIYKFYHLFLLIFNLHL